MIEPRPSYPLRQKITKGFAPWPAGAIRVVDPLQRGAVRVAIEKIALLIFA